MKIRILILAMAFVFSGCDAWLALEPENDLIKEDFWKTESDVESVIISCYETLHSNAERLMHYGEVRSGQLRVNGGGALRAITLGNISQSNDYARWGMFYQIINDAQAVMENAPEAQLLDPNFTTSELRAAIAEAKFLRALAYFYLVRIWRDVPIIPRSFETDDAPLTLAKSSESEVMDLIIKDLMEAVPDIKSQYNQEWEKWGRGTKVAAEALLADVYLWNHDYENCIAYCERVINNPSKVLLASENWFTIFSEGNTNEGIFEIQFDLETFQKGNFWRILFNSTTTRSIYQFSPDFQKNGENPLYEDDDIRGERATFEPARDQILKYITDDPKANPIEPYANNSYTTNFIIYRLADIYLLKAEAHAVLGQYDKADENIMAVRTRAGLEEPVDITNTKTAYEDFILLERQKELTAEGKSWFDLLRVGRRNNFERKALVVEKLLTNVTGEDRPTIETALQNPDAYYMPIHQTELRLNAALVQNPYYEFQ